MPPSTASASIARAAGPLAILALAVVIALHGCARPIVRVVDSPAPLGWRAPLLASGVVQLEDAIEPLRVEIFRTLPLSDGRVRLFVSVVDAAGHLVSGAQDVANRGRWCTLIDSSASGMRALPFHVREQSVHDSTPVSIVLALDHSGSMGEERTRRLQEATNDLLRSKRPGDAVGVVKFDGSSDLDRELSASERRIPVVGAHGFGGETAMFDACRRALNHAIDHREDRPQTSAVVLLTDGDDNASTTNPRQIIDLARAHGIPVFTVSFGPWLASPSSDALREISEQTGGHSYRVYNRVDFSPVFADVLRRMTSHYIVEYRSTETSWHRVVLRQCGNDSVLATGRFVVRDDLAPIPAQRLQPSLLVNLPEPASTDSVTNRTFEQGQPAPGPRLEFVRATTLDGRRGRLYSVILADELLDPDSIGIFFPLSEFIRPDMTGDDLRTGTDALRLAAVRLADIIATRTAGRCAVLVQGHADVGFGPGGDDVAYRTIRSMPATVYLAAEPAARALLVRPHRYHEDHGGVFHSRAGARSFVGPGYTNRELAFLRGAFVRDQLDALGVLGRTPVILIEGSVQQVRDPRLRSAVLYLFEADETLVREGGTFD